MAVSKVFCALGQIKIFTLVVINRASACATRGVAKLYLPLGNTIAGQFDGLPNYFLKYT